MSDDPSRSDAASPVNRTLELPSSVIERYLARPSHGTGMVFEVWFVLDGALDVDRLRDAWRVTLVEHPRVHSRLVGRGRRQRWHIGPIDLASSFVIQASDATDMPAPTAAAATATRIDGDVSPRSGLGAKLVLTLTEPDRWDVRFLFHHACCDGVGAARMIDQLFRTYEKPQRPVGEAWNREGSRGLEQPHAVSSSSAKSSSRAIPDLRNVLATVRGRNIRLRQHGNPHSQADSGETHRGTVCEPCGDRALVLKVDPDVSARLRSRLRRQNVLLNDFAVAATLHALATVTRVSARRSRYLMVMNPVEMRQWADRRSSANHLGFAYVRRRHDELSSFSDSIESVSRQLQDVRRLGYAAELASGIAVAEPIPGALRLVEKIGWFTPTASLTCVSGVRIGKRFGIPTEKPTPNVGSAALHSLLATAPIQCGGELAITIGDTGKQFVLTFRCARPELIGLTRWISYQWKDLLHNESVTTR